MDEISINSLSHIPENLLSDLDIVMDDDEFDIMQQEIFDLIPSNNFIEMEKKQKQGFLEINKDFFETEMCLENPHQQQTARIEDPKENQITSMEDTHQIQTCQLNYVSDHESIEAIQSTADSDIINTTITFAVDESAPEPYFPGLSSSDLEQRMEQSISRLAIFIKRSEMSRQRILENGVCERATSVLGTTYIS